jgi:hypothetical protein
MSHSFKVGDLVATAEHPRSIGEVTRVSENGSLTIQFRTLPSASLPFGHIGTEFWEGADISLLIPADVA